MSRATTYLLNIQTWVDIRRDSQWDFMFMFHCFLANTSSWAAPVISQSSRRVTLSQYSNNNERAKCVFMGPNIYDTFSFVFIRLLRVTASFLDGDHHLVRAGSMTTATVCCVWKERRTFLRPRKWLSQKDIFKTRHKTSSKQAIVKIKAIKASFVVRKVNFTRKEINSFPLFE